MGGGLLNRKLPFAVRPSLEYIVDNARWSFYWDGVYLVRHLRERCGLDASLGTDPREARKKILHFGSRYAYLERFYDSVHPSNRLFITWFHGVPADARDGHGRLFSLLRDRLGAEATR